MNRKPSLYNGKMLTRWLCAGLCCAFAVVYCGRTDRVTGPRIGSVIKISFADSLRVNDMGSIDSLRVTLSSPSLEQPKTYTYSFLARRAVLEQLPAGASVDMEMECLDVSGRSLMRGMFELGALADDTNYVCIDGAHLTPLAPSGLSHEIAAAAVILSWRDNSHFTDQFVVEREDENGAGFAVIGTAANAYLIDSTAPRSSPRRYRVHAQNAAGSSDTIEGPFVQTAGGDTAAPVVRVLSQSNPDTVASRGVAVFGIARDVDGISAVRVGDSLATIQDDIWRVEGYVLNQGENRIAIRAIDKSPAANARTIELVLRYNPRYVDTGNHAPFFTVLASNLSTSIKPGHVYTRVIGARDPDPNDALLITVDLPLTLEDDSVITWTPTMWDIGTHHLRARVTDQNSAADSLWWTVTVLDPRVNTPPEFITGSMHFADSVAVGLCYRDTVVCRDFDQETGLAYSVLIDGRVECADGRTGAVDWTPAAADLGAHLFTASVTDDSGSTAVLSWVVTVYDPARPTALAGNDTVVSINDTVHLHGRGVKQGGAITRLEWDIGASGNFVTASSGDTAIVAPGVADSAYVCVLRVTDNAGYQAEARVRIDVEQDPPIVLMEGDLTVASGAPVRLHADVRHRFGTIVSEEWRIGAGGQWIACDSGAYAGSAPSACGRYRCQFRATDDDGLSGVGAITLYVVGWKMRYVSDDDADSPLTILTFGMGSTSGGNADEQPVHAVKLSPFFVDSSEVTQADYAFVMGVNPSSMPSPQRPVENVTWFDAVLYCNGRSLRDNLDPAYTYTAIQGVPGKGCTGLTGLRIDYGAAGYRLPTEAEWECIAKSKTTGRYQWGNDSAKAGGYAWYSANSSQQSQNVKTRLPNALGLSDLFGNVWEWCDDWYSAQYYAQCATAVTSSSPSGPVTGVTRVIRGGSWKDPAADLRIARRGSGIPSWSSSFVGFRCVLPAK